MRKILKLMSRSLSLIISSVISLVSVPAYFAYERNGTNTNLEYIKFPLGQYCTLQR